MSARQQFKFPPTSAQTQTFVPDPQNPLHGASLDKSTNDSPVSSSTRTSTGGLGAVIGRKRSNPVPTMGSVPMNPLARPGTADPYSRNRPSMTTNEQFSVMAPTPQAPRARAPPFLSRDTNAKMNFGFKIPSMLDPSAKERVSAENNAHIPTSDAVSPVKNSGEMFSAADSNTANGFMPLPNLKFNPVSSNAGPRRVSINDDSANYDDNPNYVGNSVLPGHEITEEGRVKTINHFKRMHDEVDEDGDKTSYERPMKRYRSNQNDEGVKNHEIHPRELSPQTAERPSSGMSRSEQSRNNGISIGNAPHFSNQRSRHSGSPATLHTSTPSPYQPQPITRRQEPGALARLLGQDPDAFVQEHMVEYDEQVKRWSNCTMEEWIAGEKEIMSNYSKILDMVKDRVGAKLRLYANIHENIDKHNSVLRERSDILTATKKKVVEDSGFVLKN